MFPCQCFHKDLHSMEMKSWFSLKECSQLIGQTKSVNIVFISYQMSNTLFFRSFQVTYPIWRSKTDQFLINFLFVLNYLLKWKE
jgi:hypothetical protein